MAERRELCRLIFVRHGDTSYIDGAPPLTPKGEAQMAAAARIVAEEAKRYPEVILKKSPVPRTERSIEIIRGILGREQETLPCPELICVWPVDPERAKATFNVLSTDPEAADVRYVEDDIFDDTTIWSESRAQVRARFYSYLARMVGEARGLPEPACIVHATHHEVMHHLTAPTVGVKTVPRGGVVTVSVLEGDDPDTVVMSVAHGGRTRERPFSVSKEDFL